MRRIFLICLAGVAAVSCPAPSAKAVAPFKKAFQEEYVDGSTNEEFKAAFKKASCNTCHIKGKKKEERNPYGDELSKLIDGDANLRIKEAGKNGAAARKKETAKILAELDKAFDVVAEMESPDGTTFGQRISAGKLPAAE